MKQFIRLFLCLALPVVLWLTRHQTVYPQAMAYAEMPKQNPASFYIQSNDYAQSDITWAKAFLRDSMQLPTKASSETIMT
ncbi:MAG: hypothetical protein FGM54_06730, partial [Chitinophagaceae bacterium]|nr:hypothetical protein [Chitinophagaceae bacterium]